MKQGWCAYRMVLVQEPNYGGYQQELVVSDSLEKVCQWLAPYMREQIKTRIVRYPNDTVLRDAKSIYDVVETLMQREDWAGVYDWLHQHRFRHALPCGIHPVGII